MSYLCPRFDCKINVSHFDLYFTVSSFSLFSMPVRKESYCHFDVGVRSFTSKFLYVIGKVLLGKLSCMGIDLVFGILIKAPPYSRQ